jgi:hypothetical protein
MDSRDLVVIILATLMVALSIVSTVLTGVIVWPCMGCGEHDEAGHEQETE